MIQQDETATIAKQSSTIARTTHVVCTCLSEYSSPSDTLPLGAMAYSNTASVNVKLRSVSGDEHKLTVARCTRLREVQEQICRLFRKSFPATKVCLAMGSRSYDEFFDLPFVSVVDDAVMNVVFISTYDPYFYDLADRRRGPRKPAADLELRLSASPLGLPPPIVLDSFS